jgi:hypothetical protein
MPSQAPRPQKQQQPQTQTPKHEAEQQPTPPADHQSILLFLADEYLDAAYSQGSNIALTGRKEDRDQYYKLVATALGCLESVLKVNCSCHLRQVHSC